MRPLAGLVAPGRSFGRFMLALPLEVAVPYESHLGLAEIEPGSGHQVPLDVLLSFEYGLVQGAQIDDREMIAPEDDLAVLA